MTDDARVSLASTAAVTIDLDGARHYHAIHGLAPPRDDTVVFRGLQRFLSLCAAHEVRSTIFVVTRDLEDDAVRALVLEAHRAGHEIASHSHAHRYDLSRQSPAFMDADLARSVDALIALTGARPRGFRAPGYNQSEALLDALERAGFAYDSSFLPAPLYFAARAAALAALQVRGRRSSSLVGDVRESLVTAPFRPRRGARTRPARSRVEGRDLIEIPMTGVAGAPFIGTTLALARGGHRLFTRMALLHSALRAAPVVLELHAIDLCDVDDVDEALARAQPDVRVPRAHKQVVLEQTVAMLARERHVCTLADIEREVSAV